VELLVRDTKAIESFLKKNYRKIKEMSLFRDLKKEVETGASGTQSYVIKKGPNKDKIAK
jgi:hypothetical protein